MILRATRNYSPSDTVSHARRLESLSCLYVLVFFGIAEKILFRLCVFPEIRMYGFEIIRPCVYFHFRILAI
jgi:hypothetical protein